MHGALGRLIYPLLSSTSEVRYFYPTAPCVLLYGLFFLLIRMLDVILWGWSADVLSAPSCHPGQQDDAKGGTVLSALRKKARPSYLHWGISNETFIFPYFCSVPVKWQNLPPLQREVGKRNEWLFVKHSAGTGMRAREKPTGKWMALYSEQGLNGIEKGRSGQRAAPKDT